MDKTQLRAVAAQLAHPTGDKGDEVAGKMNDTNALITERTIEALAPQAGEFIVELGPGNGVLSRGLVQTIGAAGRYLGIEVSRDMAPVAEKTLRAAGEARVDVHAGDCDGVSVDAASIDGLFAVNVLYFVDDLDALLGRIRPWFRTGSRCVFGIRPAKTLESLRFDDFGYHIRSPENIEAAMRAHGFAKLGSTHYDDGEGRLGDITFPVGSIIIKATAD
jgi:SAM-dependent methyltransferase